MKIYHYDAISGELLGEGIADESPLEPGVFLLPGNATELPPVSAGKGFAAVFRGGKWEKVADKRGTVYWMPDFSKHTMDQLGELPDGAMLQEPPAPEPTAEEIAAAVTAARGRAYQKESDPLFFKAQRGEATMDEWLAKVAEIKARIPDGVMPS